ncbi:MAG: hypothetical protein J3K34DRAFT_515747 [Monoraphidium minutum]|nr:MAG: hypothetical protein J3K34DRAFT_515747 [Monoraphidium minutum]
MNNWVESYLDALLSAGLSTEAAKQAAEREHGAPEDVDGDSNVAAKYFTQQILAMDEESIQQAWMKIYARSNVKLAGDRDARLEHLCWRVWGMRRKASALKLLRSVASDASSDGGAPGDGGTISDLRSDEAPSSSGGGAPPAAPAAAAAPLASGAEAAEVYGKRLSVRPRGGRGGGGGGAAGPAAREQLTSEDSSESGASPPSAGPAPGRGRRAAAAAAAGAPAGMDVGVNLGEGRVPKLYCVLISMHGLVRGESMELGKDPDTGGQVKYVVELAKALSRHPAVHRVDLLTRLIRDPAVDASYGEPEEALAGGGGTLGGARIVRIACGPTDQYIRKEALWPYVREFADRALGHVAATMAALAAAGEVCELYEIHGHYGDAGEAAALMSFTLGADMVLTGHSLGRNKLDHLLKSRTMSRPEIEAAYAITRRIEAEERALDGALMVFTSTRQEVKDQWGLYDGYNPALIAALAQRPRRGRHFPAVAVVPPGLDFSALKVDRPPDPWQQLAAAAASSGPRSRRPSAASAGAGGGGAPAGGEGETMASVPEAAAAPPSPVRKFAGSPPGGAARGASPFLAAAEGVALTISTAAGGGGAAGAGASPHAPSAAPGAGPLAQTGSGALTPLGGAVMEDPKIWQDIFRFLRNPRKPVILAMSRPDAKKNITTLVRAFGENRALREIANLVLVMGNRKVIDGMASGSKQVLESVLKLIDAYDLYGSVAYPKRHGQGDISDIYLLPQRTRGVFVNIALQEPFGLTLIEAAAHGVPIVATTHGGPVDIITTLSNGILVDPTDHKVVGEAVLRLLTDAGLWEQCAAAGRDNINAYSWPSHCSRCLSAIEAEKTKVMSRRKTAMRTTYSADVSEICDALAADGGADGGGGGGSPGGGADPEGLAGRALSDLGPNLPPFRGGDGTGGAGGGDGGGGGGGSPPAGLAAPATPPAGVLRSPRARLSIDGTSWPAAGRRPALLPPAAGGGAARGGAMAPAKPAYAVLLLDSAASLAAAAPLLVSRGAALRALAGAAAGGAAPAAVGVGVASALPLRDTLAALAAAGLPPAGLDFAIAACGAQICDGGYDALIDRSWDLDTVERKLRAICGERGLLSGLPGCRGGLGAGWSLDVGGDGGGGGSHLVEVAVGAPGGAPPPPAALAALVARIKRRLRAGGVRTQITAAPDGGGGGGGARLAVTPLRASRALALRYLAMQHRVDVENLVLFACASDASAPPRASFAASDAEDLVAGAQKVLVLPPPAGAGAANGAAAGAAGGFQVDLGLYAYDARVTLLEKAAVLKQHHQRTDQQQQQQRRSPQAAPPPCSGPARPRPRVTVAAAGGAGALGSDGQAQQQQQQGLGDAFLRVVLPTALALMVCNMDRICMSVAILPMAREFGWPEGLQGVIQSAFLWGYMATQLLGGSLADKHGGKRVMAGGILWFSLASLLLPLALSAPVQAAGLTVPAVLMARCCVGLGEGVALPSMNNLVARHVPPSAKARALGMCFSGFHSGNLVGLLLSPFILLTFGWRALFLVFGVLGAPLLAAWNTLVPDAPPRQPAPQPPQGQQLQPADGKAPAGGGGGGGGVTLGRLLSHPATWAIIVVNFVNHWGYFIYLNWMPTYFSKVLGFDLRASSLLSFLPWLVMATGSSAAGFLADSLIARGTSVTTVRKAMQSASMLLPAAALLLLSQPGLSPGAAVACMTAALGVTSLGQAGFVANMSDIAPQNAGQMFGLCNTFGSAAGILGVVSVGLVVERTGSFAPVFQITAAMYVVAVAVWNLLCTGERVF